MSDLLPIVTPRPLPDPNRPLSKVEGIKANSRNLRGTLAEQVNADTDRISGTDENLLKFHGMYQQDDRDARATARKEGGARKHILMVRSKVPGGVMTADQYLIQDRLAGDYGDGTLRITTRQDFQFHGILKRNVKGTIRALNEALVTTLGACGDVVRNVMCCPLPVQDPIRDEVMRHARALSDRFLPATRAYHEVWLDGEKVAEGTPETETFYGSTYLPRKFKIALALPGDNCVDVYSNDIGIVAMVENGVLAGFTVLAGGGLGMTHGMEKTYPRVASPICFVRPDELGDVVEAIIAVQRDHGNRTDRKRARLKYLLDEWGIDGFRQELEARLGRRLDLPRELVWQDAADHLGWGEQGDGRLWLGLWVGNGRITDAGAATTRAALREVIARFHPGVRLTAQQNIILHDIAPTDRAVIEDVLRGHGVRLPDELLPVRRFAMACPALPTCGQAIAEAERSLPAIIDELEDVLQELDLEDERFAVRMTGCPNGCARPYLGDVGIVGRTLGKYNLYIGGDFNGTRLNTEFAELVPENEVVAILRPLLEAFRARRLPGETFGDFCHREGVERLREAAVPVAVGD